MGKRVDSQEPKTCSGLIDAGEDTLRLQLEEAVSRVLELESELSEHARRRADLIHLVSHELRTPITVIGGFARLLQSEGHGLLNEEQHRFVSEGLKACRRLDDFVGDLLEARADSETPFVVNPVLGDLHESIEDELESLMPLLADRGMKVELTFRASDPQILFDHRRIGQVVTNLTSNAIRCGKHSGIIRVGTSDLSAVSSGTGIEVVVEDDGPGIADGDCERIFAPFVRGEGSAESPGLGIGLAICRGIIEAHGGKIRAESGSLGGARFVFELPRTSCVVEKD